MYKRQCVHDVFVGRTTYRTTNKMSMTVSISPHQGARPNPKKNIGRLASRLRQVVTNKNSRQDAGIQASDHKITGCVEDSHYQVRVDIIPPCGRHRNYSAEISHKVVAPTVATGEHAGGAIVASRGHPEAPENIHDCARTRWIGSRGSLFSFTAGCLIL